MKKKLIPILLSAVMSLTMLSACSEKKTDAGFDYMTLNLDEYITLGNYKGLEIDMTPEATEDAINDEITSLLLSYKATDKITDRQTENGDSVNISFKGFVNGEELSGGSADSFVLDLGSNSFISGFEEGLVGVMPGSEVTLNLTFPDPYKTNPALSGSPVTFEVTVNWIEEYSYPEYTDEFVREISDYETTAEYTDYIKASLEQELADDVSTYKQNYLLEMVLENTEIKNYPTSEYDYYYNDMVTYYTGLSTDNGMSLSEMMSYYYGLSEEEFYAEAKQYAYEAVSANLIVAAIAKAENISVTDAEYDTGITELAEANSYEDPEELEELYGKKFLELRFIKEKVLNFIDDNSVTTD